MVALPGGPSPLLTAEQLEAVSACVRDVEKTTAAEIMPVIAARSSDYPRAELAGALVLGIAAALPLTLVAFGESLWAFLGVFAVAHAGAHALLRATPSLKRLFMGDGEMAEEVEEAAVTAFHRLGLRKTRDATGVLIYVSVLERRVRILADDGIAAKVPAAAWEEVVARLAEDMRQGRTANGLCRAVQECGELVRTHFPARRDDADELANLVVLDGPPNR